VAAAPVETRVVAIPARSTASLVRLITTSGAAAGDPEATGNDGEPGDAVAALVSWACDAAPDVV
jgi:hypothetical protein